MLSLAKKEKGKGFSSHGAKPHTPFYRKSVDRERRAELKNFCILSIEDRKPRERLKGFSFPVIEAVQ